MSERRQWVFRVVVDQWPDGAGPGKWGWEPPGWPLPFPFQWPALSRSFSIGKARKLASWYAWYGATVHIERAQVSPAWVSVKTDITADCPPLVSKELEAQRDAENGPF